MEGLPSVHMISKQHTYNQRGLIITLQRRTPKYFQSVFGLSSFSKEWAIFDDDDAGPSPLGWTRYPSCSAQKCTLDIPKPPVGTLKIPARAVRATYRWSSDSSCCRAMDGWIASCNIFFLSWRRRATDREGASSSA